MYITAIVVAAGQGLRFFRGNSFRTKSSLPIRISKMMRSGKSRISKPLIKIGPQPVIIYCLQTLDAQPQIKEIIVVANPHNQGAIIKATQRYGIGKIKKVVIGGRRRQDSVYQGLQATHKKTKLVLIHDAVRPFIADVPLSSVISLAQKTGAAILAVPVKATIKKVKSKKSKSKIQLSVEETVDRSNLWETQTPQVFNKDLLLRAYRRFGQADATDDAMLVEKLGARVNVMMGSYHNIKITTPWDLILAEGILKSEKLKAKS